MLFVSVESPFCMMDTVSGNLPHVVFAVSPWPALGGHTQLTWLGLFETGHTQTSTPGVFCVSQDLHFDVLGPTDHLAASACTRDGYFFCIG